MPRLNKDWIESFMEATAWGEAPPEMYRWAAISAISAALQKHVWIDMETFQWTPNFFVVFVAKPAVVAKSTLVRLVTKLLHYVPDIHTGASIITWQALCKELAESKAMYTYRGEEIAVCSLCFYVSEFGVFFKSQDTDMTDLLVDLWDGDSGTLKKVTKSNGTDIIENPYVTLLAGTTPSWVRNNFQKYMLGGGFLSRCVFVFAHTKNNRVAYVNRNAPNDFSERMDSLGRDLCYIAEKCIGPMKLTAEAEAWGTEWYEGFCDALEKDSTDEGFSAYQARKFTSLHKLAMILSISRSDSLVITIDDMQKAAEYIESIEKGVARVLETIGSSREYRNREKLVAEIASQPHGIMQVTDVYAFCLKHLEAPFRVDDILMDLTKAGVISVVKMESGKSAVVFGGKI